MYVFRRVGMHACMRRPPDRIVKECQSPPHDDQGEVLIFSQNEETERCNPNPLRQQESTASCVLITISTWIALGTVAQFASARSQS